MPRRGWVVLGHAWVLAVQGTSTGFCFLGNFGSGAAQLRAALPTLRRGGRSSPLMVK